MSDSEEEDEFCGEDEQDNNNHNAEPAHEEEDDTLPQRSCRRQDDIMAAVTKELVPDTAANDGDLRVLILDLMFMNEQAVLFGREAQGGSVALFVSGWYPYLCIEMPTHAMSTQCCEVMRELLDAKVGLQVASDLHKRGEAALMHGKKPRTYVKSVSVLRNKKSILGFNALPARAFLKICVTEPRWLRPLRESFETFRLRVDDGLNGDVRVVDGGSTQTFNSSIEATLQFMVDVGMMGCQWCRIAKDAGGDAVVELTTCQIERHELCLADLDFLHEEEAMAPLRLLSFDIEAAGRRGVFPQASQDPVIQIALHFSVMGAKKQPKPVLLSYRQCAAVEGAHVLSFDREEVLAIFVVILAFGVLTR
jgi:DNA polymerase delta subunit 1